MNAFLLEERSRTRWLFAGLSLAAAFLVGFAGFSLAGFGPCAAANPGALSVSAFLSSAALYFSVHVLTNQQRKLRGRTIPFYLCLIAAIFFTGLQILLFVFAS